MTDSPIKVTLLGTGTPIPLMRRFGPSTLVQAADQNFVFDCGRGAIQRLEQIGLSFRAVDKFFLTHLHSDHVVGIPDLWLSGWVMGREVPFRIWGPSGTTGMMGHLEKAYQADIHVRRDLDEKFAPEGIEVSATDIEQGVAYEENGVQITAFDVDHGHVKPAFGYRIDYEGRSVVLSGDTRYSKNLIEHAQDADLLIHEVIAPESVRARRAAAGRDPAESERIIQHHTTPEEVGVIFSKVKPKLAVYSHIVGSIGAAEEEVDAGTRKTYSGRFEIGEDLCVIDVGDDVTIKFPD
ncbi:MAG: MBL fold metallo-hydrolase [SAR202 cluster bacterium]|jgi:ribonuclease Z|nr:MBL fold metallo-hydrolase [SAR202 cluster bacterium]MDP6512746.1 MBL fold metallo-hydrolase [SAR202 cluster bacterium]MDP6714520.1 MBL fold metallo-hydrolase [SAR202 cluster bacterium]